MIGKGDARENPTFLLVDFETDGFCENAPFPNN